MWSLISSWSSLHKTTINCHSLIKCVFWYWRHYDNFVSDENKISLSFCFKAVSCFLWLGLRLHLPLGGFTLNSRSLVDVSFGRVLAVIASVEWTLSSRVVAEWHSQDVKKNFAMRLVGSDQCPAAQVLCLWKQKQEMLFRETILAWSLSAIHSSLLPSHTMNNCVGMLDCSPA